MLSARGKPDASGYAPPIVPDELPDGPEYDAIIEAMRGQRHRQGQVPVARRRAGAGRASRSTARLVQEQGRQGGHRRHRRATCRRSWTGRPQVAPDGRAGHAARDPQRGGARPARLQRPGPAVRRHHRRDLLQARVADAAGGAAAGAGRAVVAGAAGLARLPPQPVPQRHDAARHGDGLCRQHADGVGDPHPPARGRHQGRGRALCRARGGPGLRAGARHGAAVVCRAAVLAVGADPHLRDGGRAGDRASRSSPSSSCCRCSG